MLEEVKLTRNEVAILKNDRRKWPIWRRIKQSENDLICEAQCSKLVHILLRRDVLYRQNPFVQELTRKLFLD